MENPFAPQPRKRNKSPPQFNSFQRELEHKMKQRKKQGLTADVTSNESGQESADELGSDNELMAGFNMSRQGRSPSPRKSPLTEINGTRSYQQKTDTIFGNKSPYNGALSDDDSDNDLGYGGENMLMTMKKPMDLKTMMKSGGKKQSPKQKKGSFREEDEVDASVSNPASYGRKPQKTWEPPSYKKTSLIEEQDDEQLQIDLNKTKQRTKSPRPGRKTPSDLDSITEERDRDIDDGDLTPKAAARKSSGPVPKPRSAAEVKAKPRSKSPGTDLFGTSKLRSKSPLAEDLDVKYDKYGRSITKNKKSPEPERKQSLLDHLTESTDDAKSSNKKKFQKGKEEKPKNKYLTGEDSDDSLGEEFGRKDAVSRKSKYDQGSPLDRYSDPKGSYGKDRGPYDKNRKSPFEKDRKSPFEKDRKSPYEKDRFSPFDSRGRNSPYEDDERRASPLSIMDERKMKDSNPYADRSFGDSLYEHKNKKETGKHSRENSLERKPKNPYSKESSLKKEYGSKLGSSKHDNKEYNPFSKDVKSRDHDDRYGREDDRYDHKDDRYDHRDGRYDHKDDRRDDRYGRKDDRYDHKDDRYDHKDDRRDRRGDRYDHKDDRYDRRDDRYDHKDDRRDRRDDRYDDRDRDQRKDHRDGRKSPFSSKKDNREDDRKSPFGNRKNQFDDRDDQRNSPFSSYKRDYDDTDNKKHVGFDGGPPSLNKGRYDRDSRDSYDDYDRKPRLRRDEEDDYDRHKRRPRDDDDDFEYRASRSMQRGGKKGSERESSLCRDVEADPGPMRKPDTEEEEIIKKRQVKSHTKQSALLDQVIDSVKEEQHKFRPVDPDKEAKVEKKRTQSARHRPKPRYAKPMVESFPTSRPSSAIDPNNTTSIREGVFLDWYKERQIKAKKEKEEKLKIEKEEEEKKKKDEVDKKLESTASYNAWMEKKQEEAVEKQRKKRREERKVNEQEGDKHDDKKKDSAVAYRMWKENKDVVIQEKVHKEKRAERSKQQEEEDMKKEKEKDAKNAFRGWNSKKDEVIKQQAHEKQREIAKQKREERRKQAEREKEASKSYDKWMDKKADHTLNQKKTMKTRNLQEYAEPRPAWSPASKTIPFGR